jgi:hypothetical protein
MDSSCDDQIDRYSNGGRSCQFAAIAEAGFRTIESTQGDLDESCAALS